MERIVHPRHVVPDDIANCLNLINEAHTNAAARQERKHVLSRPNADERQIIAEIKEAASHNGGITPEMRERMHHVRDSIFERVQESLAHQEVDLASPFKLYPWDLEPAEPAWVDPTFWWARTDYWWAPHMNVRDDSEGLTFTGGVSTHDGDLHHNSFGAVAFFELQIERLPHSPSNRYRSTPHVELFGGLTAHTSPGGIWWGGDSWSKCWMHRDQQIFQFGFGMDGPVPVLLGQGHEVETLVFEEDAERTINVPLRGFQWMPAVTFGGVSPSGSLWSRVEVKFDIQTEGAGSLLWADPKVLLRTFQWALTPL